MNLTQQAIHLSNYLYSEPRVATEMIDVKEEDIDTQLLLARTFTKNETAYNRAIYRERRHTAWT